ncbi:MAG: transcription termination/antitermination protein NusG [Acutalibacteraceae bacterium]
MPDEEKAKWYVVHTYSGYENKVASTLETTVKNRNLQDYIQEIKVPTETVTELDGDKNREVERKLFPGYVFIKMIKNDETWYVVRNIRGCTGFVGASSTEPVPLSDEEVIRMGVETRVVEVSYKVGDSVRVIDGPLEDFVGIVDEIDTEKNSVKVTVSMFGRETPVELELNQAELME